MPTLLSNPPHLLPLRDATTRNYDATRDNFPTLNFSLPELVQRDSLAPSLNLYNAPRVLFLFGVAGVGKSYIRNLVAENSNYQSYEADDDLTPAMKDAISKKLPITDEMRKEFTFVILSRINEMMDLHERIVVSQAMRKLLHREILLNELGADISFVFITAPTELIDARLENRAVGISKEYAALLRKDFDTPPEGTLTLYNDGDDLRIIAQLNSFYN